MRYTTFVRNPMVIKSQSMHSLVDTAETCASFLSVKQQFYQYNYYSLFIEHCSIL